MLVSVPIYIQSQPPLSVAAEDKPLWNLVVEHKLHGVILTSGSASKVNTIVPAAIPPRMDRREAGRVQEDGVCRPGEPIILIMQHSVW